MLIDCLEKTYFIAVRFQFGQAFWSIFNNLARINYFDPRGNREFFDGRREMRGEVGRK